jgi:hypothetical protein
MRAMMRIALATTALAVGGLLTISVSDSAFARSKHVTHHKNATAQSTSNALATSTPRRRSVPRDAVANPRGGGPDNPNHAPTNATQEPF